MGIIWFLGDRWWFATVLLYGPRWIYALPMAFFLPAAFLWHRRLLWLLGFYTVIIVLPIMGLNVPMGVFTRTAESATFRVLTYNIQRWSVTAEEFSELLKEVNPDFAAVQECAPSRWILPPQWHVKRSRTSLVVSRYPIVKFEISKRRHDVNGIYCVIDTPSGLIGFFCVDLLTPRRALSRLLDEKKVFDLSQTDYAQRRIAQRWHESEGLARLVKAYTGPILIAGDFNLTVDSNIYRDLWSDYQNAYGETGFGFGYTKRTKINIFRYNSRIDHILSSPELRPVRSWTGPDMGSDHLPLIADFVLN